MRDESVLDCVIALSYGYRRVQGSSEPGLANDDLARIVHDRYRLLPKVLQVEVAEAHRSFNRERVLRIERHRQGAYLDTHEVLAQAKIFCDERGWLRPALVAHPIHLGRVAAVARHLGFEVNEAQIADVRSSAVRFDPRSEQSWTRSNRQAAFHEHLANVVYRIRGQL